MTTIIGVRFRKTGKIFYFDPTGYEVKKGDKVIVETVRGVEYGTVALAPKELEDDKIQQPLKPLIRIATKEDAETNTENERLEKEALDICHEKIRKHGLEMKLIDSEYTFDRNKLLFYFTADGRIDFRELVKDLASVFRTRIELRQIGVRDETKLMGGIAICGRPLCCHSYLSDFVPVSIKMAKEQNLSLNPSKISGVCGRLMCCLKNEEEAYEYLNKKLPYIGSTVTTSDGYQGIVQSVNVLKQLVKLIINKDNDEKEVKEYPVAELKFRRKKGNDLNTVAVPLPDEELDENDLKELEKMEQNDLENLAEDISIESDDIIKPSKKPHTPNYRKKHNNYSGNRGNNQNGYRNNNNADNRNSTHSGHKSNNSTDYKNSSHNGYRNNNNTDYRNGSSGGYRNNYSVNHKNNNGEQQNDNSSPNKNDENRRGGNYREHSRKENRRHYNNNMRRR